MHTASPLLRAKGQPVLFELAIESRFADSEQPRGQYLVPLQLPHSADNRLFFHLADRDDAVAMVRSGIRDAPSGLISGYGGLLVTRAEFLEMRGQVGRVELSLGGHRTRMLDRMLQLTHIARPIVFRHQAERILRETMRCSRLEPYTLQKVFGQKRNILSPVA